MCLSFYQVLAVRDSVYGFSLPAEFGEWLSVFEVLTFDLGSFLLPSWTCVGSLTARLVMTGLWPLVLMVAVVLFLDIYELVQLARTMQLRASRTGFKDALQEAMLRGLEASVLISFCVLPSITRALFLAFQCESFGFDDLDGPSSKSYLTASLNVECSSGEHEPIMAVAVIFIFLWPVGAPLLYSVLLWRSRQAILKHQPTTLSRTIHFLWSECRCMRFKPPHLHTSLVPEPTARCLALMPCADDDSHYWWELVELARKLVLTSFLLFVGFDSGGANKFLRVVLGLLIALLGLTLQLVSRPYRRQGDNALNCVLQLMLVLFFLLGIVIKLCNTEGANAIHSLLDAEVEDSCMTLVGIDSAYSASVLMICVSLAAVVVPFFMFVRQLLSIRSLPVLRDARTMEPPVLLLGAKERYHIFLCATRPVQAAAARAA